jgi:hypothetical protein
MYLDPQDGKDPMFTAAVRLLHNHGESLDPLQVLEVLRSVYISVLTSRQNCFILNCLIGWFVRVFT